LGRNILNVLSITFDGACGKWDEHKSWLQGVASRETLIFL
jgi:hypothetical protein